MNLVLKIFVSLTTITVTSSTCLPSSCAEVLLQGNTQSGIYTIHPRSWYSAYPFQVYCDMQTDGGGWTLFQKRDDYEIHENFYRNWRDYKLGFGDLNKEFWLGNDHLYILTNQDYVTLRVDLQDFEGNTRNAEYSTFQLSDERNNYRLSIAGYHGNAGDGLTFTSHTANNSRFTTYDRDDESTCAEKFKGGWWYNKCHAANLNGQYLKGNHSTFADGINWYFWLGHHYSLKKSEMKIRPTNFKPHSQIHLE